MSGIAVGFKLDYRAIVTIPSGLPLPNLSIFTEFSLSSIIPYIFTALTLALLGAIDSLLTSVVADNMTKTKHKPNKELVGQGIGNTIGAIFGGLTGASFSFVQMLQNPSDFHVNWIGLPITLLASICLFFILRLALQKMPILMRRSVDREA